jgi:hypothetical protein
MTDDKFMTIEEGAERIFEEANHHGVPLPLDVCRRIAQRLMTPRYMTRLLEPGEIARKHRERYEEE